MKSIKIPIAEDCYSTFYLRDNGFRFESYYFDWLVLSPETVLNLFKTDFNDFFVKENLRVVGKGGGMTFKTADIYVQDIKHDIFYLHHFNNIDKDFLDLKEKFERKIDRMNQHFKNNEQIEFYFKQTKYVKWIDKSKTNWGVDVMNKVYPELKKIILEKYSYQNDTDIKLIIL